MTSVEARWGVEPVELGYRCGPRRGRLLLTHPGTGWRISLPAGPLGELARVLLRAAAVPRPRGGTSVFRVAPGRGEVAALITRVPRPR